MPPMMADPALPTCRTCVHFLPNVARTHPSNISDGLCRKYWLKDVVTGAVEHERASVVRSREDECGHAGTGYHEQRNTLHRVVNELRFRDHTESCIYMWVFGMVALMVWIASTMCGGA